MEEIDGSVYIIKTAKNGLAMQDFYKSDVGKLFLKRAESEEREAELEFRSVDPADQDAVRAVQNKLLVVDMFRRFILETIESGHNALDELDAPD